MDGNVLIQTDLDKRCLETLLKLRSEHSCGFGMIVKSKKYSYLREWIDSKTPLLQDGKHTLTTKLYWIVHGLTDFPVCSFCHKTKMTGNVDFFEKGYFRACSVKCEGMQKAKQEKIVNTCIRKWGATNFFGSKEGKAVREKWCENHGVENPFQLESVKEKSCHTRKERIGCEYTMQSEEKRRLASENYMRKTGYEHQFKDPAVIRKSKDRKLEKKNSGIDDYAKTRVTNRKNRYRAFLENEEVVPLFSEQDFLKLDARTQYTTLLRWKCRKCGNEFDAFIDQNFCSRMGIPARCEKCHPVIFEGVSNAEREFIGFLEGFGERVVENDRTVIRPYELDAYLPERKFAFEYNGLYWHSEDAGKSRNYHLMKTEMCKAAGIRLVHVFEDEWKGRKDIVKSMILNMFGKYEKTVFARKCAVAEINSKTAKEFLDANHLQGSVCGSVRLGLFYNSELVSLMTFGKCRFDKIHEWEMLRFCCRLGYHMPGAAGKLLRYFERTRAPKSLVTYADRRWSDGNVYKALGFDFVENSPPGYFYIKHDRRYSRIAFQKHKLKNLLEKFDESKTEVENMKNNGYFRIFDCGNMVFEKTYPENVK